MGVLGQLGGLIFLLTHFEVDARVDRTAGRLRGIAKSVSFHKEPRVRMNFRASGVPSWVEIQGNLPEGTPKRPYDTALNPIEPDMTGKVILFRDRNGWCPYSERVWLAMMGKGLDFSEVLVDNQGTKPSWYYRCIGSGSTPAVRWDDGKYQTESMDIAFELEKRYPSPLFPSLLPSGLSKEECGRKINDVNKLFPKNTRPSSRSAYLFKGGGIVPKAEFEATLDGIDNMLGENRQGSFFVGDKFSLVDVAWAPFLERLSVQVPLLHRDLYPRDPNRWPNLNKWYQAMETLPFYPSRVQGDTPSWTAVLAVAGYGNAGMVPSLVKSIGPSSTCASDEIWSEYASGREGVAPTPNAEAASLLCRNRDGVIRDAIVNGGVKKVETDTADKALRVITATMFASKSTEEQILDDLLKQLSEHEKEHLASFASFLSGRVCVPRDMGALPARAFRERLKLIAERAGR